jgi:hypothetical protein
MSGAAELDKMIRKIKGIPEIAKRAAPKCAERFDAAVRAELAAGNAPDGSKWAPTRDGTAPLKNAAGAATVTRAVGTTIVTSVQGHYFHHNRPSRGMPRRAVIPTALTTKLAEAIRRPLVEEFERSVRRG